MRAFSSFAVALLALSSMLAACSGGDFPSLAQRPVELAASAPAPPPPVVAPAPPLDPAFAVQLDKLTARARTAHGRFTKERAAAERAIAAAARAKQGSEAWIAGNSALSVLEAARADLGAAVDEIGRLYADDRVANAIADADAGSSAARPTGAAIGAAYALALELAQEEDAAIVPLRAGLPE